MPRRQMPTALKMIKGERPDRVNQDEPQPSSGVPQCPSDNPAVQQVWDYTLTQLGVMRVVTMADRDMLHAYCEAVVAFREATATVEAEGSVLRETRGVGKTYLNPAVRIADAAAARMHRFGTEFGLSPSSRTRIKVADQKPEKKQGAGRLLSG